MRLSNLMIDRIIVHSIRQNMSLEEEKFFTQLNNSLVLLTDDQKMLIANRVVSVSCNLIQMVKDPSEANSSYEDIVSLIRLGEQEFIEKTQKITKHLSVCQNTRRIPDSSILYIQGTFGFEDISRCIILIKADIDDILQLTLVGDQIGLSQVKDAILGKEKKLFKVGLIMNNRQGINVFIYDSSMTRYGKQNMAQYFSKRFFGCKPEDDSVQQIEQIVKRIEYFIWENYDEKFEKTRILSHLYSYLSNESEEVFSIEGIKTRVVSEDFHDRLDQYLTSCEIDSVSLIKDAQYFSKRNSRMSMKLSSGVEINAFSRSFNDDVVLINQEEGYTIIKIKGTVQ